MEPKERLGDFMLTYMGVKFYPADPRPSEVRLFDIAHPLSQQCRFTGHLPFFYSVAQHSINVALELKRMGAPEHVQLMGLLHDGSEAYIADINRPAKSRLSQYYEIETLVQNSIWTAFDLTPEAHELSLVRHADDLMLAVEGYRMLGDIFKREDILDRKDIIVKVEPMTRVRDRFISMAVELSEKMMLEDAK